MHFFLNASTPVNLYHFYCPLLNALVKARHWSDVPVNAPLLISPNFSEIWWNISQFGALLCMIAMYALREHWGWRRRSAKAAGALSHLPCSQAAVDEMWLANKPSPAGWLNFEEKKKNLTHYIFQMQWRNLCLFNCTNRLLDSKSLCLR